MTALTFGSLFSGYGGIEMGAQSVLGGELLWYSEYEPPSEKNPRPTQAAARIMAATTRAFLADTGWSP